MWKSGKKSKVNKISPETLENDENWFTPISPSPEINLRHIIGDVDANVEWNHNDKKSENIFFHTLSYSRFKEIDQIYLYGRRGSGKTSIIRMLEHEVNSNKCGCYDSAALLKYEDEFCELVSAVSDSPLVLQTKMWIINFLKNKWKWIITTSAIKSVYLKYKEVGKHDVDIANIAKYLENENLIDEEASPIKIFTEIMTNSIGGSKLDSTVNISAVVNLIREKIKTKEREKAEQSLHNILKVKGNCVLVLLDTLEYIDINDRISKLTIESMIEAVYSVYKEFKTKRIIAKLALPSEIKPYLNPLNPGKIDDKSLLIVWTYKDIVCLLAKRLYTAKQSKFSLPEQNETLKSFDKYQNAVEFLKCIFPAKIKTSKGFVFDSIAYIIRHTQKKPRHIISLINSVLTYAMDKHGYSSNLEGILSNESITKGVHARLEILCAEVISIYNLIYGDYAQSMIHGVLYSSRSRFNASDLDKKIASASSIKNQANMTSDQIKRLFLESGVIGIEGTQKILNEEPLKLLINTDFEYQLKQRLTIQNENICAVHPMMYQYLNCTLDKKRITYPVSSEDEEHDAKEKTQIHTS